MSESWRAPCLAHRLSDLALRTKAFKLFWDAYDGDGGCTIPPAQTHNAAGLAGVAGQRCTFEGLHRSGVLLSIPQDATNVEVRNQVGVVVLERCPKAGERLVSLTGLFVDVTQQDVRDEVPRASLRGCFPEPTLIT